MALATACSAIKDLFREPERNCRQCHQRAQDQQRRAGRGGQQRLEPQHRGLCAPHRQSADAERQRPVDGRGHCQRAARGQPVSQPGNAVGRRRRLAIRHHGRPVLAAERPARRPRRQPVARYRPLQSLRGFRHRLPGTDLKRQPYRRDERPIPSPAFPTPSRRCASRSTSRW